MVAPKRKTCYQTENATANQETHPYYLKIKKGGPYSTPQAHC